MSTGWHSLGHVFSVLSGEIFFSSGSLEKTISHMSSNTDAIYAISLALLTGAGLGNIVEMAVTAVIVESNVKDNTLPIRVLEVAGQTALSAVVANEFLRYMTNRGLPMSDTPFGLTPFIFFLFYSQSVMLTKLVAIGSMIRTKIILSLRPVTPMQSNNKTPAPTTNGGIATSSGSPKAPVITPYNSLPAPGVSHELYSGY